MSDLSHRDEDATALEPQPPSTNEAGTSRPGAGPSHLERVGVDGRILVDRDGDKIGKLHGVYVDVETDEPQFATVIEGMIGRHLTFVPLAGVQIGPDDLRARPRPQAAGA